MNDDALLSAFDDCLHELEAGASLDEALRHAPAELVDDLRPMLEAADFARVSTPPQPSAQAQAASRTNFLSLAQEARRAQKRGLWAWLSAGQSRSARVCRASSAPGEPSTPMTRRSGPSRRRSRAMRTEQRASVSTF